MKNNFTKEDIIKKHETNVKSASSSFSLVGILGLIYVVRYFVSGNLNFYFSLAFAEMMLRLYDGKLIPLVAALAAIIVFFALYIFVIVLIAKDPSKLKVGLGIYLFDCLCLAGTGLIHGESLQPEFFIDVIVHAFVIVFLAVGIRSAKALKK